MICRSLCALLILSISVLSAAAAAGGRRGVAGVQPLSRVRIHVATLALDKSASVKASPGLLGPHGEDSEWIDVEFWSPSPSADDWIGVFSPAKFNSYTCPAEDGNTREQPPLICSSPIKYQFANYSNPKYANTGNGTLRLQLINQRADFSLALFSGGLANPKLVAVSNTIAFANPKAPVYPRLSQGKAWNEMTVTWTSGYDIDEALPFVEWGAEKGPKTHSPAGTLTFSRNDMCGSPARTFGWRHPGYIHTSFLKDLWPNAVYTYKLGHQLFDGTYVWSKAYSFRASPYPGQDSLQRVIIFGDMGKAERDGSNEYSNYQPGSLNTTDQLVKDLDNIDIVFHIGDITYANGYISQWDQFRNGAPVYSPRAPRYPKFVMSVVRSDRLKFQSCPKDLTESLDDPIPPLYPRCRPPVVTTSGANVVSIPDVSIPIPDSSNVVKGKRLLDATYAGLKAISDMVDMALDGGTAGAASDVPFSITISFPEFCALDENCLVQGFR